MKIIVFRFGLLALAATVLLLTSRYAIFTPGFQWGEPISTFLLVFVGALLVLIGLLLARWIGTTDNKTEAIAKNEVTTALPNSEEQVAPKINYEKLNEWGLSKREYEVLQLVADGMSNKEIADALFISEHTVKSHVSGILLKIGVQRRTQAVKLAKDWGVI